MKGQKEPSMLLLLLLFVVGVKLCGITHGNIINSKGISSIQRTIMKHPNHVCDFRDHIASSWMRWRSFQTAAESMKHQKTQEQSK